MKLLSALLCSVSLLGQTPAPRARNVNTFVFTRQGGGYLGVSVVEIDSDRAKSLKLREERGVQINNVAEGSAAAKAGLKPDDVVQEYNGQRVEGYQQFLRMVSETPVGRKISLGIIRNGAPLMVTAVVEPRPAHEGGVEFNLGPIAPMPPMPPSVNLPDLPRVNMLWRTSVLGVETESLNTQLAEYFGVKQGVLVRMVSAGSHAERAGIKAGDIIVKADGKTVETTRDISSLLRAGKTISLGVVRNHKDLSIDVLLN